MWSTAEGIRIRFLLSNAFTALFASLIAVGTEGAAFGFVRLLFVERSSE